MNRASLLRRALGTAWRAALGWKPLRDRAVYWLKREHFPALQLTVPLAHGLVCPIPSPDAVHSFSEIFVAEEYRTAIESLPLPRRWIDVGCHAGYFSLYLAWQRAARGDATLGEALLIDGDSRAIIAARQVLEANGLLGAWRLAHGAIGPSAKIAEQFACRPVMSSGAAGDREEWPTVSVPVLHADRLLEMLPPPYDVVKIDVEGAESHFVLDYQPVLAATRALIVEWHQPPDGEVAVDALRDRLKLAGFDEQTLKPFRTTSPSGERVALMLYKRPVA